MHSVTRSITLSAPAAAVWRLIGDFSAIDQWMPGIDRLNMRNGAANAPGVERVVHTGGTELVERLTSVDDSAMTMAYTMPDPPFPISGHRASLEVSPASPNACTVTWTASFEAEDAVAATVDEAMGDNAFQVGLDALAERFAGGDAT